MIDITPHFNDKVLNYTDFQYLPPADDSHPSPIWMGGGRTNHNLFAVQQIDVHVQSTPFAPTTSTASITADTADGKGITIKKFLQYGPPQGHPELLEFAKDIVEGLQNPKSDVDYLVTSGSGDSLTKLLNVFMSPGDTILVENYAYTPIFGPIESCGVVKIPYPIVMETGGPVVDVDALKEILDTWETGKYKDLKKPKVIYTVPTQNPLGLTQPRDVIEKVYALCQKHDLIIFEDDPDGYIHMDGIDTFESFKKQVVGSSYLNLDVDGRVMRMETFSKLFCPGIRLGFIAARPEVIQRALAYSKIFTKTASGISQAVLLKTVEELGGGYDSYLKWCFEVSKEYKRRRDLVFDYLHESDSVKKGYIELVKPDGGMFFVIKVNFPECDDVQPLLEKLYYEMLKTGVIVILGRDMAWDDHWRKRANFLRLTNTNLDTADECLEGAKRLDIAVVNFFGQL
ncbi:CYFA0S40e00364g1_1 [Cyberlindnera fabianii]|uniref:Aromatic amino acid aminotransferase 2 n=1 Tax=Cyberlindnera fabianii TaxID=36022 RepID=A0A061BLM6_CYBFA|nr:Aromatic amino acid aminotransferase 2 [Cyberlindnera fabianii]CDR47957.1 CYFA0S40e00364g1_1 [Cyberlindnera fabianii]